MSTIEEETDKRHRGHVKFFNSTKGFGFILPDDNENIEVFVHHTAIHNDGGFKSLAEGEEVEYDLVQGPKGMQASHVTGPNGVSVKGAPRINAKPQFPSSKYRNHQYYNNNDNNNNNNAAYYNRGFVVDPYMPSFGYSFPYMQPYGQPSLPPNAYPQYVYNPQQLNYPIPPANYYNDTQQQQQQTMRTPSPNSSKSSHDNHQHQQQQQF